MYDGARRGRHRVSALVAAGLLAGVVLAGCDSSSSSSAGPGPSSPPTSSAPVQLPKQTLTFGVIGASAEIAAYRQMASRFAPLNRQVTVQVESWPDEDAMIADLRNGAKVPDVFLAARRDLAWLDQHQLVQPVDQLLDDRGVDFGDDYPRTSLTAFGTDNRLDCLPYDIDPSVIFINKRLVHFRRMKVDPPAAGQGWTLDQFAATARWAVRHHPGVTGAYLGRTIDGVGPFVLSGGGQLFAGGEPPSSLGLSSPASQQALTRTRRALRGKHLTLSQAQLARRTPEQWFADGRLAMIEATRRLVPQLRSRLGLDFDVMPMPSLGSPATTGELTGLCVSRRARDSGTAADFVVYASSPDALGEVASAGYLQPANQTAALSNAFLQPGHLPKHASVFTFSVKSMVYPPVLGQWDELDAAVSPMLEHLFRSPPSRIPALTRRIDAASRPILGTTTEGASPGTGG
ncbi:MAG: extracellular solute-binding protein [Nocardioides sp.]